MSTACAAARPRRWRSWRTESSSNSKVVGKALGDIRLPEGVTIGAMVRGTDVLIAHRHVKVQTDDHVIMFLVDKSRTREVEKLFQVGFGFF